MRSRSGRNGRYYAGEALEVIVHSCVIIFPSSRFAGGLAVHTRFCDLLCRAITVGTEFLSYFASPLIALN